MAHQLRVVPGQGHILMMIFVRKHFDGWSLLVILVTLILFVTALFAKGLTHDLLLEAGVFLVSVKLILMTYRNGVHTETVETKLIEI
jgi:hypothetical protein